MIDSTLLPITDHTRSLRPLLARDAPAYVEGTEDVLVRRYAHLPEPTYTINSVTALAGTTVPEGLHRGDLAVLSIVGAADDAFIGSLVIFDITHDSAEVGFWLHPAARGHGHAAASLELAATLAARSGLATLTARTAIDNPASQQNLLRAGFTSTGAATGRTPSGEEIELRHYERRL